MRNARSPRLNLEGLYGDGPVGHPFLFQRDDPAKLLTAPGGRDLLRNTEGTAIIGDPRNDSHVVMSQMHLAFVHAHNAFVDRARASGQPEARRLRRRRSRTASGTIRPSCCGNSCLSLIGCRAHRPDLQAIAATIGRGISRSSRLNLLTPPTAMVTAQITAHLSAECGRAVRCRSFPICSASGRSPPSTACEWARLFDADGEPPAARAKKIDGTLVGALIALPVALTGESEVEELHSLAVRDLERGQGVGLPSGEAVARRMGETPLSGDEVGASSAGWSSETPLWYYILREAEVRAGGNRLGPVGSRIVGEVLVGLLDLDPASVRHAPSDWKPQASLIDLLMGLVWVKG